MALELVYVEVNKLHHNAEDGTKDDCSCAAWNRYILPCRHQIQRVNPVLPPLNIDWHNIDRETLSSVLRDPSIALPRNCRPRGTRRLQTSADNILNATDRREIVRRCGSCHQAGHNRRRCPKFLSQQSSQGIECQDTSVHDVSAAEDDSEMSDANNDVALEDAKAFHDDEDDAAFELMWADVPSLT
ncbi:hypothetical protein V1527DRAFT_471649 [Lipomyces starkeyi]